MKKILLMVISILCGVLLVLASATSMAGAFKLEMVDGASVEEEKMCAEFLENLNSFPAWPPMVCERPIAPKFSKKFWRPKWRRWTDEEILSHQALLKEIYARKYPNPEHSGEQTAEEWLKTIPKLVSDKILRIDEAMLPTWGMPQRWIRYEIFQEYLPAPGKSKYATQSLNCSQHHYYQLAEDGDKLTSYEMFGEGGGDVLIYANPEGDMYYLDAFDAETDLKHTWTGSVGISPSTCFFPYRAPKSQRKGNR